MRRSKSHERLDFDMPVEVLSETLRKAGKKPPKRTAGIHPGISAQHPLPANLPANHETKEKQRKEELIIKPDGDYSLSSVEDLSSELKGGPGPLRQKSMKAAIPSTLPPKRNKMRKTVSRSLSQRVLAKK